MKQQLELKESGSLVNFLMANNMTVPVVGCGATILYYSDRQACEVIDYSSLEQKVTLQKYVTKRLDKTMGDNQIYVYDELESHAFELYYRRRAWRYKCVSITFELSFLNKFELSSRKVHEEYKKAGGTYNEIGLPDKIIKGITRYVTTWPKVNIIFGVLNSYYDCSF